MVGYTWSAPVPSVRWRGVEGLGHVRSRFCLSVHISFWVPPFASDWFLPSELASCCFSFTVPCLSLIYCCTSLRVTALGEVVHRLQSLKIPLIRQRLPLRYGYLPMMSQVVQTLQSWSKSLSRESMSLFTQGQVRRDFSCWHLSSSLERSWPFLAGLCWAEDYLNDRPPGVLHFFWRLVPFLFKCPLVSGQANRHAVFNYVNGGGKRRCTRQRPGWVFYL